NESKGRFEYSMDNILAKYNVSISSEKVKALNEIEKIISDIYSAAERDIHIQTVSKSLGIDAKSIKTDVERIAQNMYQRFF
ncbi:MAG: hypothetical protein IKW40_02105, partial [Anaerotignum sp.]|nr:hypothetical protein [Anaerotignum sp.]